MTAKWFRPFLGAAAVFGLLATVPAHAAEKVIRAVPLLDVKLLDPYVNTNYGTRNHAHMIYEELFAWDSHLQPHPQMVGDWSMSKDARVYHFTLRPDLKWSDGKPVTTADVLASLDRWFARDAFGVTVKKDLVSIKADDDKTFTMTFSDPFPLLPFGLGRPSGIAPFMLPERIAKLPVGSPKFEPIGSGPFIFKKDEWQPGVRNVYVKNPSYVPRKEKSDWFSGGKDVHVDKVIWQTMPDANTAVNALLNGEIDMIESVPYDVIPQVRNQPKVVAQRIPYGGEQYLRANWLLPPFNNVKARRALLYMVDPNLYGPAVTGDKELYEACPALFMCGTPYETAAGHVKPSLDKARQLMKELGYKGEKVVLMEPTNVTQFDTSALLTAQLLRKIGVNVELQPMDYNMMLGRRAKKAPIDKGGWNLFNSANQALDMASPVTNIYLASNCGDAAPGWPCDKKIEELRSAFARATSEEERKNIAVELQKRAYEVVPYVPVIQEYAVMAYSDKLTGVQPSIITLYWGVEKKGE